MCTRGERNLGGVHRQVVASRWDAPRWETAITNLARPRRQWWAHPAPHKHDPHTMDYTKSHRIMAVMLEHNRAVCWLDTTGRITYISGPCRANTPRITDPTNKFRPIDPQSLTHNSRMHRRRPANRPADQRQSIVRFGSQFPRVGSSQVGGTRFTAMR